MRATGCMCGVGGKGSNKGLMIAGGLALLAGAGVAGYLLYKKSKETATAGLGAIGYVLDARTAADIRRITGKNVRPIGQPFGR